MDSTKHSVPNNFPNGYSSDGLIYVVPTSESSQLPALLADPNGWRDVVVDGEDWNPFQMIRKYTLQWWQRRKLRKAAEIEETAALVEFFLRIGAEERNERLFRTAIHAGREEASGTTHSNSSAKRRNECTSESTDQLRTSAKRLYLVGRHDDLRPRKGRRECTSTDHL